MIHFAYYKKVDLLESKFDQEVKIHDILAHYNFIEKISSDHTTLKALIDCRTYKINVEPGHLDYALPVLLRITKNISLLKEAIIVDEPQSTVLATIFEDKFQLLNNYLFKVFSTEHAARIWLGFG